jgi:Transposase C of IS166 homeodomain
VRHHHRVVQIDLAALPDDPNVLQQMLREVVPELQAENEKLWQLIQRLLRHRYGPRSEKLDLEQLQLVLEDAEQSAAEDDAAKGAAEPAERRRRIATANRNRGALPRTSAALRGRRRRREQAVLLLWRCTASDRRGSQRDARPGSRPAASEGGMPATLWLSRSTS